MTLEEILIHRCNEFLWVHMYSGRGLEFKSHQHRDLVRTFFAGVFEMLIAKDDKASILQLSPMYAAMCDENWWPDERFNRPEVEL